MRTTFVELQTATHFNHNPRKLDSQICPVHKILRGFYPKEVEDILNELDKIEETAVFGVSDKDFGERVIAAIVMADKENFNQSQTESFVNDKLARYKKPKEYVVLEALPRNTMGKVQKNELRKRFSNPKN